MPAAFLTLLLAFLGLLTTVQGQAPGDGDENCLNLPGQEAYPPNQRALMDSRDYENVLVTNGISPWQTVDVDNDNDVQVKNKV